MNPIIKRKTLNLIHFVFNDFISESHKNLLLMKYSSYDDFMDIINDLIIDIYTIYYGNEDKMNYYLAYVSSMYFDNKDIKLLKENILERLELNYECGDCVLEENHQRLIKALLFICRELNKMKVDYYVVGSVPIYIKLNLGFKRYHTDVDIAINSRDVEQLEDIFRLCDYKFFDNRFCSQKFFDDKLNRVRGGHEIIAQDKSSSFSIGFYEFDRLDDGGMIKKDYFSEVIDGKLLHRVCKSIYSKEFVDLYYSQDFLKFLDIEFRYCNIEGIYVLKQKNKQDIYRNKDSFDVDFIKNNYILDEEKIKQMNELINEYSNYVIEDI